MNRRESLKTFILGTVGGSLALHGCAPTTAEEAAEIQAAGTQFYGRTPKELARDEALLAAACFTPHELESITVLANLILPPGPFGGIKEAKVPEFIEFMAKDIPKFQRRIRGGLAWLDHQASTAFGKAFKVLAEAEQKQLLDPIAFYEPDSTAEERPMEVNWFGLMRGLTMTGYWTSAIGIKDLGYTGNVPNVWDGVPQAVLEKHGVAYDEAWLAKCVDQSKREVQAEWDDAGNLLT